MTEKEIRKLIIPDVHQKLNWKYALDHVDEFDSIVFVGDYFDHHGDADVYDEDAIKNFEEIIAFKKQYPEKVHLGVGNHDIHYLIGFDKYSNYQRSIKEKIYNTFVNNIDYLEMIIKVDDYYVSHAGVTKTWYKDKINCIKQWKKVDTSALLNNDSYTNINAWWNAYKNSFKKCAEHFKNGTNNTEEFDKIFNECCTISALFEFPRNCWDPYGNSIHCPPTWIRPDALLNDALFEYQIVGHTGVESWFENIGSKPYCVMKNNNHVIFIDNLEHDNLLVLDSNKEINWKEL